MTYFIEQWKSFSGHVYFSGPNEIIDLPYALKATKKQLGKTIAVFKIIPKPHLLITGEEINGQSVLIADKC